MAGILLEHAGIDIYLHRERKIVCDACLSAGYIMRMLATLLRNLT